MFPSLSTTRAEDHRCGDLCLGKFTEDSQISTVRRGNHTISKHFFSCDRAGAGRFGRFNRPMRVVDKPAPNDRREKWRIRHPFCCWLPVGFVWNPPLHDSLSVFRDQRVFPVSEANHVIAVGCPPAQKHIRQWHGSDRYTVFANDCHFRHEVRPSEAATSARSAPTRSHVGNVTAVRAGDWIVGIVCAEERLVEILRLRSGLSYQPRGQQHEKRSDQIGAEGVHGFRIVFLGVLR